VPRFTLGIEEEYLLVDRASGDLAADPPPTMMDEAQALLVGQVSPEFLRSQIEVGTAICRDISEARLELSKLRSAVCEVATRHDLAVIAASTHPFGRWGAQLVTDKERYTMLERDLAMVARRLVIGGMHVHVEIGDADLRIDLMNQVKYFLPHLLALSTSSPFWHGYDTGLKSYRLSVFGSMPRTGFPDDFSTWTDYERHVQVLVDNEIIEDASKMWWHIRPSARFPTLEMRVADVCTRLEDALAVAALYVSLLHLLYRRRSENQRWRQYASMLISENLWRAQRYGVHGSLMDFGRGDLVPFPDLVDEMVAMTRVDAEELGCVAEVEHTRTIAARGTSADLQLATYGQAMSQGATEHEALRTVVDLLIDETTNGLLPQNSWEAKSPTTA
jgi:carboxylate-amine ligase